ncbi:MAG: SUMF1/EgtB/PvdO family nonheme iron enzyme [Ignavibacteria bacterium]|nr:SUMF1/EgtB/PvdO family nonheme iron enzyme [Ignavibacteria bacterium]
MKHMLQLFLVLNVLIYTQNNSAVKLTHTTQEVTFSNVIPLETYTIELWIKFDGAVTYGGTDAGAGSIFNFYGGGYNRAIHMHNGKLCHYTYDNTQRHVTGASTIQEGVWYHVAIVAQSHGMMRLFINGTEEGTSIQLGALQPTDMAKIGSYNNPYEYGVSNAVIDELRVSNSIRYTGNFTPSSTEFVTDANTVSLYHFNEGSGTQTANYVSNSWTAGTFSTSNILWVEGKFNNTPQTVSIPMITIQDGTFTMGCTGEQNSCDDDEYPTHQVSLSAYEIGKYEITQREWRTVMGTNPSYFTGDNKPVDNLQWIDAINFCNTLSMRSGLTPVYSINGSVVTADWNANGYRLPTEAEWEFAARGGSQSTNTIYSGSNDINSIAWQEGNAGSESHNVGTLAPNQIGIYDMSGNVYEWCWDWYSETYYTADSQNNPTGPLSGTYHSLRGGSWLYGQASQCRVVNRGSINGPSQRIDYGFRVARTIQSSVSSGDDWKLIVNGSTQNLFDQLNYAGVDSLATEGYDPSLDTPNPPTPPGNYIDAYFYHPEWNSPLGSKFASDVKQSTDLADTVKRWFFEVETNVLNDTVKLQFTQENVPSKFGKYLTDMQTGKRVDLRYTDTYRYYNTSSSPRKFQLIIGDSTSPVISNLIPKGDEIWRSNSNKTVSWTMSDGTGIDSVFLYSSNNNGTNYTRFASIGNISNYNWSIPQEYLNNGYRVKTVVRDSLGNLKEIFSPLAFTVVGDSLLTQSTAGWNLTGTPLSPNDTTLTGILGDDITTSPYFVWGYTLATGYTLPLGMSFGTGYWLGLLNNHTWDVRGTAVESDSIGQSLNLGYNLIGTKYVREVSKDRMTFVKSGTAYNFNQAVTAGLISNAIFGYNGSGYTEEDTLSLFGGYWLGVLQEGVTLYQKPVSTQLPLSKGNQEPELFTENNWKLRLNAESGIQSDNITEIGVTETATAGYDTEYDAARPPVPPVDKFIEIYSEVSGTGYPQFLGNKYARDFKNTPSWTIKVKKGNTGSNEVTINWNRNEIGNLPDGMRIMMTDLVTGQAIDMRRDSSYSFTYSEERTFQINGTATGIEDAVTAPTDFSLSQNYPNPFNPSTKIRYSIPEESRVKITVYNSLGEMVKILTNETAQRGWYETTFEATQIPSGIYFAKIEAQSIQSNKQFIQTIKMLLIK